MALRIPCAVLGYGARGKKYMEHPGLNMLVVCEPQQRNVEAAKAKNPDVRVFTDWREFARLPKQADIKLVFICTQDVDHYEPAMAMAALGYDIVLEKPMGVTEEQCRRIGQACIKSNVYFRTCHIMRFAPHNKKMAEIVRSGVLGQIVSMEHKQGTGHLHFARSYVRGAWGVMETSSPTILAKCCHDLDLLLLILGTDAVEKVYSNGGLTFFRKENKPEAAKGATRCMDCPLYDSCEYSAKEYVEAWSWAHRPDGCHGHPIKCIATDEHRLMDIEDMKGAIRDGPYGLCVFGEPGNTAVDNQTVAITMKDGKTATLTMTAFSETICGRDIVVRGSLGMMSCTSEKAVEVQLFGKGPPTVYTFDEELARAEASGIGGHEGADFFFTDDLVKDYRQFERTPEVVRARVREAVIPHLLGFAAERSRLSQQVVSCDL